MQNSCLSIFAEQWFERWQSSYNARQQPSPASLFIGEKWSGVEGLVKRVCRVLLPEFSTLAHHPDYLEIHPENHVVKIEQIRLMIHKISLKPLQGKWTVVVIHDVDQMTLGAANALLKSLEEPPPHVVFLLIASSRDVLSTIRSRCQILVLPLHQEALFARMAEVSGLWKESVFPLFLGQKNFSSLSEVAETLSKKENQEHLPDIFLCLKALWHDLLLSKNGVGESGLFYFEPFLGEVSCGILEKNMEQIVCDFDAIVETERAVLGNVNKTLAFEQLFMKLTG